MEPGLPRSNSRKAVVPLGCNSPGAHQHPPTTPCQHRLRLRPARLTRCCQARRASNPPREDPGTRGAWRRLVRNRRPRGGPPDSPGFATQSLQTRPWPRQPGRHRRRDRSMPSPASIPHPSRPATPHAGEKRPAPHDQRERLLPAALLRRQRRAQVLRHRLVPGRVKARRGASVISGPFAGSSQKLKSTHASTRRLGRICQPDRLPPRSARQPTFNGR